jgi:hypothetical protein
VTTPPEPPATTLDWDAVLAWRPRLADVDVDPGGWQSGEPTADGTLTMPHARLSDDAAGFLQGLYDEQVIAPFDWGDWLQARGRRLLVQDPALETATLEECRMLLAALARSDRFVEGAFLGALSDGTIERILRRVARLLEPPPAR